MGKPLDNHPLTDVIGTTPLLDRLRAEGYDVSHAYVAYLLRDRIIPSPKKGPGGAFWWLPGNVLALTDELRRREKGIECQRCHSRRRRMQGRLCLDCVKELRESPSGPVAAP